MYSSRDEWIKYTLKKEEDIVICDIMDEPGEHYVKWHKPDTKKQLLHELHYIWNLKKVELTEAESGIVVTRD